ncbi:hypothetical protein [Marinospirillum perlucidum]|uniref:hypothetical protein n=1 Tax=Marinospirillum perlucidum TaxID=1982602 RepID=UPI001FE35AE6|nr:hypothetical protein [Marinospirillum perlucidum]
MNLLMAKLQRGYQSSALLGLSGWLLFTTLILALISTLTHLDFIQPATLTAWAFVLLEYARLKRKQKIQILVLFLVGLGFASWAWQAGSQVSLLRLLEEHLKLAMLLAAVNFIRLSTQLHRSQQQPGPANALWTLGGMHIFSSVANFSSMLLVGEQLKRGQRLPPLSQIIVARGFSLAVIWSPFLSILPLVLEQVPGSQLGSIYPPALLLAATGLVLTGIDLRLRYPRQLARYSGYPLTPETLLLPLTLVASILLAHWLWPQEPTIGLVSLLAILTPLTLLTWRSGPLQAGQAFVQHLQEKLADARAEVALFLCAGFLAAGVKACIQVGLVSLPVAETNASVASLVLVTIVVLAYAGIHQFALVAIFAGLLAEVTTTPTLMALAYIAATSLSMSGSAFSGVNFILQARFHARAVFLVKNNLIYSLGLLGFTILLLYFLELTGIK